MKIEKKYVEGKQTVGHKYEQSALMLLLLKSRHNELCQNKIYYMN